jgi:murein DD-endopeptidase MepM/ murein hydrolase activator NlpD
MPAAKKQRGATVIRSEGKGLPQFNLPHKHVLAIAAICASIALAIAFLPSDDNRDSSQLALDAPSYPTETPGTPESIAPNLETEAAHEPMEPPWVEQTVRRGDNLSLVFKRAGFGSRDVHEVVSQAPDGKALGQIYPGQTIAFQAAPDGSLQGIEHIRSPLETAQYWRGDFSYESRVEARSPEVREARASGEIVSSLFLAGQEAGLSQNLIMEMANIFGGVIDFVLDPRQGDTIHLIYEELYLDDEKFKDGDIVAASFTNQGKTFSAYRYRDANGDLGYFNEDGVSMRKAFLLAPVDFTRISSNFNLRRLHPIYKTNRPHRGTDYAASTGTPVFAAGDGRVSRAGYSRSNGNYVFIQHGEQYVTKYLHLHKRKVKQGQRVSQSQVIGTVGSTGAATGPHLHYEFLMNGVHRNPRTIHKKLPKAKALPASELADFQQAINGATLQLASLRTDNKLAMNTPPGDDPQ